MGAYNFADFVENTEDARQSIIMYEELAQVTNIDGYELAEKA